MLVVVGNADQVVCYKQCKLPSGFSGLRGTPSCLPCPECSRCDVLLCNCYRRRLGFPLWPRGSPVAPGSASPAASPCSPRPIPYFGVSPSPSLRTFDARVRVAMRPYFRQCSETMAVFDLLQFRFSFRMARPAGLLGLESLGLPTRTFAK